MLLPGGLLSEKISADAQRAEVARQLEASKADQGLLTRVWQENAAAEYASQFDIPVTLAAKIHEAAEAAEIEPKVAFGLVRAESSFRRAIVSPAGAVGYTQLLPSTARWLVPGTTRSDLYDEETNLRIGFKYLRTLVDKYDGDVKLALTAYNRGPGTVDKALKRGRNPDNGYAEMILTGKNAHQTGHAKVWLPKKSKRKTRRA